MAYRRLVSKIFYLCCRDCEEPHTTDDSTIPSQIQEQPSGLETGLLGQPNPKYDTGASHLPLGQPLIHPEKESSTSSSDFEAHPIMASKFCCCCCCQASEGPPTPVRAASPRLSQEQHPRTFDLNASIRKNSSQKRHLFHSSNMEAVKAFNLRRP
ncbi:testis-expressed protein 48 [Molossus nigricans]